MSDPPVNPLHKHPAFAPVVGEIGRGTLGQRLSAYASARSKRRDGDPLLDLGASLLDFLLSVLGERVETVMATTAQVNRRAVDAWFLTIRFADGLVATVDLGSFLPDANPVDLELRLEICGTDRVIVVEPSNVAVTIIGPAGLTRDDCYPERYDEQLGHFAHAVGAGNIVSPASSVIDAARRSAASGEVVVVS